MAQFPVIGPEIFNKLKPPLVGEDTTNPRPDQYEVTLPGGMTAPSEAVAPTSPGHPFSTKKKFDKSDFFLNLLSNFTYALGQGLSQPTDMQGAGAALIAPFQLRQIKRQEEIQRQQMERAQAQEELYRQQAARQQQLHEEFLKREQGLAGRQQAGIAERGITREDIQAFQTSQTSGNQSFRKELQEDNQKFRKELEEIIEKGRSARANKPVPGRDIPLSPEVMAQKKALSRAGIAMVHTEDAEGNAVVQFVPREVGAQYKASPTADMRNKEFARGKALRSVEAVESLSKKVITKRGVAQRATAMGRSVEAALGNDPEYRTYQGARMGLAGNLAVLQQGSRPSDADIKAIWLPLVPDIFRDTDESAKMKWDLIKVMSGFGEDKNSTKAGKPKKSSDPLGLFK